MTNLVELFDALSAALTLESSLRPYVEREIAAEVFDGPMSMAHEHARSECVRLARLVVTKADS